MSQYRQLQPQIPLNAFWDYASPLGRPRKWQIGPPQGQNLVLMVLGKDYLGVFRPKAISRMPNPQ
jgi:hypothetical protein